MKEEKGWASRGREVMEGVEGMNTLIYMCVGAVTMKPISLYVNQERMRHQKCSKYQIMEIDTRVCV